MLTATTAVAATQDKDSTGFQEASLYLHTETAKDLDTTRVENISDRSWYEKTPAPIPVGAPTTPVLEGCCMRGVAKDRRHIFSRHRVLPSGAEMGEYGQDHTYTRDVAGTLANGTRFSVRVAAVADGHGSNGGLVSRDVILDLDRRLTVEWLGNLLAHVVGRHDDEARAATDALYEALDAETSAYWTDGTTLSVLLVFSCEDRVFFVASNVGDSPILLIHQPSGKILCAHAEHTWDSVAERRVQLEASRNAGRDDAVVVYGRFNCDNGISLPDPHGTHKVLPMFLPGTDVMDEAMRRHVLRVSKEQGMVGGTQTVRKMKTLRLDPSTREWNEEVLEAFGHENFGSTPRILGDDGVPHGGCQMTRGLGDHAYKSQAIGVHIPLLLNRPSLTIMEMAMPYNVCYVVCSDGVGDAFYWHQIGDALRRCASGEEAASSLFSETLLRGRRAFHVSESSRAWDDLSMVVGRIRFRA